VARDANASAPSLTSREPLAPGDTELAENVISDNSVLVEVRVLTPSEMSSHRAPIEGDGSARFRFDGPVHLAWFRADHRHELGHAPASLEVQQDLAARPSCA
jgi:hypothetical protein